MIDFFKIILDYNSNWTRVISSTKNIKLNHGCTKKTNIKI